MAGNLPKITVLVPTYNVERYLLQCLDALCAQTLRDVVCIPVREAPIDFHKTYVVSRDEGRQPKVVQEFIDFMSAHRFPRLLS